MQAIFFCYFLLVYLVLCRCEKRQAYNVIDPPLCSKVMPNISRIELSGFLHYSRRHFNGTCRLSAMHLCGNEGWTEEWPLLFKRVFPTADVVLHDYSAPRLPHNVPVSVLLLNENGSYSIVDSAFVNSTSPDIIMVRAARSSDCQKRSNDRSVSTSITICIPVGSTSSELWSNITFKHPTHTRFILSPNEFCKAPTEERIHTFAQSVALNRSSPHNNATYRTLKRLLFPGTISPNNGQLKFLSTLVEAERNNVSWLSDFEIIFIGKMKIGSYWSEIEALLTNNTWIKYQKPRVYYGSDYIAALCNASNAAAVFWSREDYNPRSVYEALFCNLPVFVSKEATVVDSIDPAVGRIISIESDRDTVVRSFQEFLDTDWGDRPYRYAVKHMSNHSEFRRIMSKLNGSNVPCQL